MTLTSVLGRGGLQGDVRARVVQVDHARHGAQGEVQQQGHGPASTGLAVPSPPSCTAGARLVTGHVRPPPPSEDKVISDHSNFH